MLYQLSYSRSTIYGGRRVLVAELVASQEPVKRGYHSMEIFELEVDVSAGHRGACVAQPGADRVPVMPISALSAHSLLLPADPLPR